MSSGQSVPRALYRRKLWHAARRAHNPVRSTQEDRHDTLLRSVPSSEPVPRESDGRFGTASSSEPEAPTEPPVLLAANSQAERIIPQVTLTGYHLHDPRGEDYAPGFRGYTIREEHKPEDRRTSAPEESNAKVLYDSTGAHAGPSSQIYSDNAQPLVISACNSRSDRYGAKNRDIGAAHHAIFCTLAFTGVTSVPTFAQDVQGLLCLPETIGKRAQRAKNMLLAILQVVPIPEACHVTHCP